MLRQHAPKMWRPIHVWRRLAIEIGLGLLVVVAALLGAVWYMRYTRVEAPAAQPYELTRPANMPNDGSVYVEYLSRRPAVNPNLPNIGTGSAYDGSSYGAGAPLVEEVNCATSRLASAARRCASARARLASASPRCRSASAALASAA